MNNIDKLKKFIASKKCDIIFNDSMSEIKKQFFDKLKEYELKTTDNDFIKFKKYCLKINAEDLQLKNVTKADKELYKLIETSLKNNTFKFYKNDKTISFLLDTKELKEPFFWVVPIEIYNNLKICDLV